MGFLDKLLSSDKKASTTPASGSAPAGEKKPDLLDAAFAFGSKQMGFKIDPKHQEAFTDAGRSAYEKQSGKKIDPKISN